jgi:hypothetical protein
MTTFKPGTYVIDTNACGRYNVAVYRVERPGSDQTVVSYVGEVISGRLTNFARDRQVSYRVTSALREWR